MAIAHYPGYEIERFEDEGGRCYIRLIPKSSADDAGGSNARKEERHEKHQESEAVRKAEG